MAAASPAGPAPITNTSVASTVATTLAAFLESDGNCIKSARNPQSLESSAA
jgi:hypothetical protein